MEIAAPAKINLYLNILAKRDDGYHEIETLFEKVSLADNISVEQVEGDTSLECNDPAVPCGVGSLMMRVISAFNEKTGGDHRFKVVLEKNIPVGAGLGGGSSDAAALLKAINEITGFPLELTGLVDIARFLGADIPFFVHDASFAYGKNRGDVIEKAETSLKLWHIIVNPPFEVSTAAIYGKWARFGLTKHNGIDKMFSTFLKQKDVNGIAGNLHNDLQEITLGEFPEIRPVFSELRKAGAKGVLLSGSGPTVFGIFDEDKVVSVEENLKRVFPAEKNWKICSVHTYL